MCVIVVCISGDKTFYFILFLFVRFSLQLVSLFVCLFALPLLTSQTSPLQSQRATSLEFRPIIVSFGLFVCIVQELCESRGGRLGLSVLTSLLVSVDVKIY